MGYKNKVLEFIDSNDENSIKEYHDKLYENLRVLCSREEKLLVWVIIIIFLYYFSGSLKSCSINFGLLSIGDNSEVLRILPVMLATVIFLLQSITLQKLKITHIVEIISTERFAKEIVSPETKSFLVKVINPFTLLNSLSHMISEKLNWFEIIVSLILFTPLFVIGLSPYFVLISMLNDLYCNHFGSFSGKLCFWITLWLGVMTAFYYVTGIVRSIKENIK